MLRLVIAVVVVVLIMRVGMAMLRGFSRPPEAPEPGQLRKVNLRYRCSICGAQVKMVQAAEDLPAPPRHCQEDMDLVAPLYD